MNLLFKLLDPRSIVAQFTLYAGGGGQSTPAATSQTNTVSSIAPWAQPGVEQLISTGLQNVYPNYDPSTGQLGAQNGYTPFDPTNTSNPAMMQAYSAGQNTTAGFSPLQQQSFNTAANLQVPGQYNAATGLNNQAGYGALGTTGQANMYGQMGAMAGNSYGMNAQNPNAVANYMNPYLQNTLAPSLQLLNQQYGMQNVANNAQATQAGAFGGSRMGVQNALTNQAQNLATNQLVGNAYNQAYNTANTNMQSAANLGIQGAQAGLAGIGAQQAGYNSAGAAGSNLSNIGTAQLGAQQSVAGLQNAYGAQQQQQQQNILNTGAQNYSTMQAYPMQQLQQLEGLYTGAPTNTTTQNYQAPPSILSQAAGLGMAGYGLSQLGSGSNPQSATPTSKAKGGRIKAPDNRGGLDQLKSPVFEKFAEGGIVGFLEGGLTPADYRQMIIDQAKAKGVDPAIALAIGGAEGNIKNPKSTANGFFQLTDSTFKGYKGDPAKRNDPSEQIRVGTDALADNTKKLTKLLGRSPQPHELYATHFLGESTGQALLRADPNTPMSTFLKDVTPKHSQGIIEANPEILGKEGENTVGQVKKTLANKINAWLPMGSAQAGTLPQAQPQAPEQAPAQAPAQGGLSALIPGQTGITGPTPAARPEDTRFLSPGWFMQKGEAAGNLLGNESLGREVGRGVYNTMMAPTPLAPVSTIPRSGGIVESLGKAGEQIYNKFAPTQGFTKEGLEALQAENQAAKLAETSQLRRLTPPTAPLPAGAPTVPVIPAGQGIVDAQEALTQTRLANEAADNLAAAQKAKQLLANTKAVPSAAEVAQNASLLREGSEAANTMAAARAATTAKQLGATTSGLATLGGGSEGANINPGAVVAGPGDAGWGTDLGTEGAPGNTPAPVRDLSSPDTGNPEVGAKSRGISPDFLTQLGFGLMAGKSPYALTNLGEAGLGALKEQQEAKKYTLEERKLAGLEALQQQQGKYYGAYADAIERGSKEKNLPIEAEKLVDAHMKEWIAANPLAKVQTGVSDAEEKKARQEIYQRLGIPVMGGSSTIASKMGTDPLGLRGS